MSMFSVILITILTFILSNKIIKPIDRLKLLSRDISRLNFRTEEIKTNDEIEELANSINTLLYWAKYEKKEFTLSRFDLETKVLKIIENYEILMQKNIIDIEVKIDKGDFIINADESSIEMVLNNLLSNAVKYNTDNKIELFLLKEKDEIFLSVVNGCADIYKDKLDDIWKPFNMIDKSRNKELSGTGLGLSIVKEVLEAHSFDYGVELYDDKIEFYVIFK